MGPSEYNSGFFPIRFLYYIALTAWFAVIAFWLGPHIILFHRLSGLSLADFAPVAEAHLPVVLAIKRYQADNGHLPEKIEDIQGNYLPANWGKDDLGRGFVDSSGYTIMVSKFGFLHELVYNLDGNDEHWQLSGQVVNGRIPLLAITLPKESPKSGSQ
ncbi:MAG TPA: hypothetical protein VGN88_06990 [Phycisphaerae bacterium]|jgi:hypothetical protein